MALRKSEISPTEAISLFAIVRKLIPLVEPAQLESWVKMCRAIPEGEFTQSQIIQAAVKLVEVEEAGTSYEQALENLNNSAAEIAKLEAAVAEQRTQETQLKSRKKELLQANQRLEAESTPLQGKLKAMAVKEKEEQDRLQKLGNQVKLLHEKRERLETETKQMEKETSRLQEKIQTMEEQVTNETEALENLQEFGFSRRQLELLRDRLSEIAQNHGTSDVIKRFFSYLSSYESLLNLGVTRENLAAEVKKLTEEKEALTRLSVKMGLSSEQVAEGMAALKSLQHKGVLPPTLVSYQRVLSAAGLTPETFEKIVTECSGVEKALAAKKGELGTVDQELEEKGQALEQLQGELGKVKQSINSLRDSGTDQISTMRDSVVKQINSMVNSAAARGKEAVPGLRDDISQVGRYRGKWAIARMS